MALNHITKADSSEFFEIRETSTPNVEEVIHGSREAKG
jgi:hypothetical protein